MAIERPSQEGQAITLYFDGIQVLMIRTRMGIKNALNLTDQCLAGSAELANPYLNQDSEKQ